MSFITAHYISLSLSPPLSACLASPRSDEVVTCSVCDRAFTTARQLIVHQNNRKHFGCSKCDVTFSCVQDLRDHKDKLDHWSDLEEEPVQEASAPSKTNVIDARVQSTERTPLTQDEETKCHRNNPAHADQVKETNGQMKSCFDEENLIVSLAEMERLL